MWQLASLKELLSNSEIPIASFFRKDFFRNAPKGHVGTLSAGVGTLSAGVDTLSSGESKMHKQLRITISKANLTINTAN